jgi:hypothetical protein
VSDSRRLGHGWGTNNVFKANTTDVNGPGWGFNLAPGKPIALPGLGGCAGRAPHAVTAQAQGDSLSCDNTAIGAAKGLANTACT